MGTQELILNYLKSHASLSSKEIFEGLNSVVSYATIKRYLSKLLSENHIVQQGNAKNSRYFLSSENIYLISTTSLPTLLMSKNISVCKKSQS